VMLDVALIPCENPHECGGGEEVMDDAERA
jgi:hypothetical protein